MNNVSCGRDMTEILLKAAENTIESIIQSTYPCFPGIFYTSSPHNILSKPLATFPHSHRRNNGKRRDRDESYLNDYHQFSERIPVLASPGIEPLTAWSLVLYTAD